MKVVVLDYGSGNLRSAERALARTGAEVTVTSDLDAASEADGLVVPGVGDEAHLEDGAIFVKAKGTWVGLRLLRLDDVDTGPSLIKLAGIAIGRLA